MATHDLNLASLFCDRLLLLKEGKIIQQGGPEDILKKGVLQETYGKGVEVIPHPTIGRPVVLPRTGHRSHKEKTS